MIISFVFQNKTIDIVRVKPEVYTTQKVLIEHRKANRNDIIMHTNPTHPHYFRHLGSYFALFVDPPATLNCVELIKNFMEVS